MNGAQQALLHLTLIDGVGPALIQKIYTSWCKKDVSLIYQLSIADFLSIGLTERQASVVKSGLIDRKRLASELVLVEKYTVGFTTILDDDYPFLLKNIHVPPPILYWWGRKYEEKKFYIALVGSRKAQYYTRKVADLIVPSLVENKWVTVSGGARGADSIVHKKTVDSGGITIVVLGSGLLQPYPFENKSLFEKVIEVGGTVMSIFPLQAGPLPHNFPARNRVIAGLCHGTVVLQAAQKSGALITARYALEQGREVFAVPGSIEDELSKGPHALIQQGAHVLTHVDDLFDAFQFKNFERTNKSVILSPSFSKIHQLILDACSQPCSFDTLIDTYEIDSEELLQILFDLHLEGHIEQNHAGMWRRI